MTRRVNDGEALACFSDAFSAGLDDAKIVLALQRLASWSASPL